MLREARRIAHRIANLPAIADLWDKMQESNDRTDRLRSMTRAEKSEMANLPACYADQSFSAIFRVEGLDGLWRKCNRDDRDSIRVLIINASKPVFVKKLTEAEVDAVLQNGTGLPTSGFQNETRPPAGIKKKTNNHSTKITDTIEVTINHHEIPPL